MHFFNLMRSPLLVFLAFNLSHGMKTETDVLPESCTTDQTNFLQSQFVKSHASSEAMTSTEGTCKSWCASRAETKTWDTLCNWAKCSGCSECYTTTTAGTTTTITTTTWQSPYFSMTCDGEQAMTTYYMTCADYDAAVASITALYEQLPSDCNATYCPQADWAGCILRIAGHDFMDYKDGTGGSDACMDMHDPDNNGLAECFHEGEFGISVADAYKDFCTTISLADFVVLSAEAVMTLSRQHTLNEFPDRTALDFRSRFEWGRTTAKSCSFAEGRLPNPENSCSAVDATFVQAMGLDWELAAALMGVHSLGRAKIENSGYNGWWSDFENSRRFNNNYYTSMVLKGWAPETSINGNSGKNQWMRVDSGVDEANKGKEMMLDTDMCLYFTADEDGDVELKSATGLADECNCTWASAVQLQQASTKYNDGKFCGSTDIPAASDFPRQRSICCGSEFTSFTDAWMDCGLPISPKGPAASFIKSYANDEDKWITKFYRAWKLATTNGAGDLKRLRQC